VNMKIAITREGRDNFYIFATVDAIERESLPWENTFDRNGITAFKIEAGTANNSGQLHERYTEVITNGEGATDD
jgi:hypothetical protein